MARPTLSLVAAEPIPPPEAERPTPAPARAARSLARARAALPAAAGLAAYPALPRARQGALLRQIDAALRALQAGRCSTSTAFQPWLGWTCPALGWRVAVRAQPRHSPPATRTGN